MISPSPFTGDDLPNLLEVVLLPVLFRDPSYGSTSATALHSPGHSTYDEWREDADGDRKVRTVARQIARSDDGHAASQRGDGHLAPSREELRARAGPNASSAQNATPISAWIAATRSATARPMLVSAAILTSHRSRSGFRASVRSVDSPNRANSSCCSGGPCLSSFTTFPVYSVITLSGDSVGKMTQITARKTRNDRGLAAFYATNLRTPATGHRQPASEKHRHRLAVSPDRCSRTNQATLDSDGMFRA